MRSLPRRRRTTPNFYVQLLFAIFFGGVWDYPIPQIRATLEQVAGNIGVDRLIWGTDIPMVMRFVTYRQSLEVLRVNLDFLTKDEIGRIVGGNMGRLMGLENRNEPALGSGQQ